MAEDDSDIDGKLAIRIMRDSDSHAEAELCRRLWPRIRAYGLRRLRSEQDALDLAQHVLVVMLEALRTRQVKEPERIAAFVMGACRNTLLDRHKIERRRAELLEVFSAALPTSVEALPPIPSERLEKCLEHLSARDRAIVVSTYLEERSATDIAHQARMELGAVRVTRHRALKQLLHCMEATA